MLKQNGLIRWYGPLRNQNHLYSYTVDEDYKVKIHFLFTDGYEDDFQTKSYGKLCSEIEQGIWELVE